MKKGILWFFCGVASLVLFRCETADVSTRDNEELTGNSVTYALQAASDWNVSGTVIFNERKDGSSLIEIKLSGLNSESQHPVHLHLGDVTTDDAAIAALLQPLDGKTGESRTMLTRLADETEVRYNDLKNLEACIKIHLAAFGEGQNVVLAAGNIGSAQSKDNPGGRQSIGICRSN